MGHWTCFWHHEGASNLVLLLIVGKHPSHAGLLNLKEDVEGGQATMDTVLMQRVPPNEMDKIKKLLKKAAAAWWLPGHPGWAIWPIDTQHFMQDMSAPVSSCASMWCTLVFWMSVNDIETHTCPSLSEQWKWKAFILPQCCYFILTRIFLVRPILKAHWTMLQNFMQWWQWAWSAPQAGVLTAEDLLTTSPAEGPVTRSATQAAAAHGSQLDGPEGKWQYVFLSLDCLWGESADSSWVLINALLAALM